MFYSLPLLTPFQEYQDLELVLSLWQLMFWVLEASQLQDSVYTIKDVLKAVQHDSEGTRASHHRGDTRWLYYVIIMPYSEDCLSLPNSDLI